MVQFNIILMYSNQPTNQVYEVLLQSDTSSATQEISHTLWDQNILTVF